MKIVPVYVWNHLPSANNRDGLVARSEQPVLPEVIEERRTRFRQLQDQDPNLNPGTRIVSNSFDMEEWKPAQTETSPAAPTGARRTYGSFRRKSKAHGSSPRTSWHSSRVDGN